MYQFCPFAFVLRVCLVGVCGVDFGFDIIVYIILASDLPCVRVCRVFAFTFAICLCFFSFFFNQVSAFVFAGTLYVCAFVFILICICIQY